MSQRSAGLRAYFSDSYRWLWIAFAVAVLVPSAYLWVVDRHAIREGVWTISETYTTGLGVAGLPVEEMAFFVVTNLFVVQALVLFRWVVREWR